MQDQQSDLSFNPISQNAIEATLSSPGILITSSIPQSVNAEPEPRQNYIPHNELKASLPQIDQSFPRGLPSPTQ